MNIVWARRATIARNALIDFIAEDNVLAALELDDLINAATLRLVQFPLLGKPGRIDHTRELVIHTRYILVYEVVDDTVMILMVVHASRQWPPLLEE